MKLNKKAIIILVVFIVIICITIGVIAFANRTIDVSDAIHTVTIEDEVTFYKKAKTENVKIYKNLEIGSKAYVLETFIDEEGNDWSKVVVDNKVGYILSEKLGSYKAQEDEKVLMLDVSHFNQTYSFETAGEFSAFIINNNINYVYIRAGGRGYGDEGNFYYDDLYETWANECEYLQIPFGFYFLDEALNSEEIDEEVEFIENFLKQYDYEYAILPVALDIEKHNGNGRADDIWEERAELVSELISKLDEKDISSIIYSNATVANEYLSDIDTKFWVAYYATLNGEIPDYWYSDTNQEAAQNEEFMKKVIGWQFTETGVEGLIDEEVDLSLIYNEFF